MKRCGGCWRYPEAYSDIRGELMLQPGDVAPAFSLPSDEGKIVSLSDFRGKNILLYFFVKALTPG
jgi:peroxiredoxin